MQIALAGGEVDAIVSDWLSVAQQRAGGMNYVFNPFSAAVGVLLVPADSPAWTLAYPERQGDRHRQWPL